MKFKSWFYSEGLSGPGDGSSMTAAPEPEELAAHDVAQGVGAFPTYNKSEDPPLTPRQRRKRTKKY